MLIILALGAAAAQSANAQDNLAAGKTYTFSKAPNYPLCTDEGDATDLTDTKRITDPTVSFWGSKSCVGWSHPREAVGITVDLGEVSPIGGAAFCTAAGSSGVAWPAAIDVLTSDDGESFQPAGELIRLMDGELPPAYGEYAVVRFVTSSLRARGRYVRFEIKPVGAFVFVDEIEVLAGDASRLDLEDVPVGGKAPVDEALALTRRGCYMRIRRDLETVRRAIMEGHFKEHFSEPALAELKRIRSSVENMSYPDAVEGFRAIVPINDLHRSVYRVQAMVLKANGAEPLTVWHSPPYRTLSPFAQPEGGVESIAMSMMNGERRGEAINFTNASPRDITISLKVENLPVVLKQVEFVDTREGRVVQSAIVPLGEGGVTPVPAGMTRQVWLSFEPKDLDPGTHAGSISWSAGSASSQSIPVHLAIAPMRFPDAPTLNLTLWDYVFVKAYGITDANQAIAAKFINDDPFVTSVWANPAAMPKPKSVDAEGNVGEIDFSQWDAYVKMFPGKRNYFIFLAYRVNSNFYSHKPGTATFDRAIGQWGEMWAKHNREVLGLKPKQATALFIDEPGNSEWFKETWQYSRAMRQGTDEIAVFNDPSAHYLDEEFGWDLVSESDIVCPTRDHFERSSESIRTKLSDLSTQGKSLWFYMCSGPSRMFDPSYHRLQPWHCFIANAVGSGFWAFGDTGRAESSWNGYPALGGVSYSPVYIDSDSIHTSKDWESIREGMMDYEYLVMLRNRINALEVAGKHSHWINAAKTILENDVPGVIDSVRKEYGEHYVSTFGDQCVYPETVRRKALEALIKLNAMD